MSAIAINYQHNLRVYGWVNLLSKRVYQPLIAIYLVDVGHLSFAQLGIITAVSAASSLLFDIPTGYFADRTTRKTAMTIATALIAVSTVMYALIPSFAGAIVATLIDSLGYSFLIGAGEALMHDTLVAMGRIKDYVKVMGRAQSYGLLGNIVLVSLVPLTYAIDKRLPFLCGTVAVLAFMGVVRSLKEPPRDLSHAPSHPHALKGLIQTLRAFVTRRTILFFAAYGLISGSYIAMAPFSNLIFRDLGLDPSLMGFMFAGGSAAGALAGWFVHYFKHLSLLQYALVDTLLGASFIMLLGSVHVLWILVIGFFFNMGFWRVRGIVYQEQLLRRFGSHGHKATLISAMSFFENANTLWLPLAFVTAITAYGLRGGFAVMGVGIAVAGVLLFWVASRKLEAPLLVKTSK